MYMFVRVQVWGTCLPASSLPACLPPCRPPSLPLPLPIQPTSHSLHPSLNLSHGPSLPPSLPSLLSLPPSLYPHCIVHFNVFTHRQIYSIISCTLSLSLCVRPAATAPLLASSTLMAHSTAQYQPHLVCVSMCVRVSEQAGRGRYGCSRRGRRLDTHLAWHGLRQRASASRTGDAW